MGDFAASASLGDNRASYVLLGLTRRSTAAKAKSVAATPDKIHEETIVSRDLLTAEREIVINQSILVAGLSRPRRRSGLDPLRSKHVNGCNHAYLPFILHINVLLV